MICKIYTLRTSEKSGCIIIENEAGEIIASSGCEEGIPTLCTEFCQAWINNPLPEVEIWESDVLDITNAYTEEFGYLFTPKIENEEEHYDSEDEETFEEWLVGNGLEITLPKSDLEKLEDQWNSMNHLYEIVCEESEDEDDEPNAPTYQQYQACENQLYRMVDKLKNQLPEIPSEIYLETDQPFITSETEAHLLEVEQDFQQMLVEEGLQRKNKGQFLDFINNEGEHFSQEVDKLMDKQVSDWQEMEDLSNESEFTQNLLITQREKTAKRIELERYYDLVQLEKEGRQNLRKHVLVKRKDMQPRVDFSLLPNAASIIWSAVLLFGQEVIDVNSDVYQHAVKVANNLDLYFQNMKNPKFATRASFEIEKILNK